VTGSEPRVRPGWVTTAVVLLYIGAILQITVGILAIFLRYAPDADEVAFAITLIGAGIILFGLFMIGLASGVARGSRPARLATSAVILLVFALSLVDLFVAADGDWTGVTIQLVLMLAVLLPLWVGAGRRYFAPR
jgi:hypothetical protein